GPAGPASAHPASAVASPAGRKQVSYQGYTFEVPRSWPVVREARHLGDCVRFDEHVVYLGVPAADQSCPSRLLGTTEALLIEPGPAAASRASTENPVSREITVTAPRISITATFDANPNVLYAVLASARLPAPRIQPPNPALLSAAAGKAVPVLPPKLPARPADFRGKGFDACTAPSSAAMTAWKEHSPYGAVGIYIGGSDRACDQANLTAAWIRRQASAGWHFFPMYVGPQAAFGELKSPASQGMKAAADAVVQARKLGFGPRTPLYYDMEYYPAKYTRAALRFLSAWSAALHRLGYLSGVYSSSSSGIVDLAREYSRHHYVMPDTIFDALWNGSANVRDKVYRRKSWPRDHRLHQFSGNDTQKFGGFKIDLDKDYLDVSLAAPRRRPGPVRSGTAAPGRAGG
ncbi:MAG: glycoside hydrolase domain-containing protein, partial [Streptosporangiaceae bacterium]